MNITALGFDFGTHRIGVAVGQTLTKTANPLTIIRANEGVPDWTEIDALIVEWRPQVLVVGFPLNMDDTESEISVRVEEFIRELASRYKLPIYRADERLSTFEAHLRAKEIYKKSKGRRKVDNIAAQVILESWLYLFSNLRISGEAH